MIRDPSAVSDAEGRVLAALLQLGGICRPADLDGPAALIDRTRSRAIRRLADAGLVTAATTRIEVTPLGRSHAPTPTALAGVGARLTAAIEVLPPAHGALLRLLCAAVVARWELIAEPRAWFPAFAVYGEPGTGKTALGEMVCWIFGWDPLRHITELGDHTGASLVGHRVQGPGGRRSFDRASYVDLPFVMLDEFHEGEPEVRKRADTAYLGGHARVLYYDDEILVRPTVWWATTPAPTAPRC